MLSVLIARSIIDHCTNANRDAFLYFLKYLMTPLKVVLSSASSPVP